MLNGTIGGSIIRGGSVLAAALFASHSAVGQVATDAPPAEVVDAIAIDDETGLPVVKSREDYERLTPQLRDRFNRSRRPGLTTFADVSLKLAAPAELAGRNGEVRTTSLNAAFGPSFRVSDNADFALRFETNARWYDFRGASDLLPGAFSDDEPFDEARVFAVTPVINVVNPDGWNWLAGARIASSGENSADFGDTIVGGGFAAASYPVTSNLRIGGGVLITSRLAQDGVLVFPIPVIEWFITDKLSLGTAQMGGLSLAYEPAFGWRFSLDAGFDRQEFRLDDDGPIAGGAVIDRSIAVSASATYSPHPRFGVTATVGADVWGEFQFFSRQERLLTDIEREPALFGALSVSVRF